jgi:hypothetical protein
METELSRSTSSGSESSAASTPLALSLANEDENERVVLPFAPIVDSDGDSDFREEQALSGHGRSPSIEKKLVVGILAKQIVFALAVGIIGPKLGRILYNYQCYYGGLSERPPPYSFDDSGNIVLDEHLNNPQVPSSVPGKWAELNHSEIC